MDKSREAFEKKFPIPAHWIEFDEKRNKYYCPYVADAKASEYQAMWEVWQSRQAEFDSMTEALLNQTQLLAKQNAEVEELREKLGVESFHKHVIAMKASKWIVDGNLRVSELEQALEEKDKRINELERSCISYKNQRDDNAQKLMVKSIHYNSIQEELAKLKDRLELAHHLASQSAWSSLKQLKKVVKALRGEHANS